MPHPRRQRKTNPSTPAASHSPGALAVRRIGWQTVGPAFVALLVFLPALRNGFTGWDDGVYIIDNPHVTAPGGLGRIWTSRAAEQYYPLTFTTFWIEYRLWGAAPLGYHATNVLLHALDALLLVLVLRGLGAPGWTAAAVSLLFAVHPVQTMTVAWIAERKNLLSCAFVLLAMLSWLRFRARRGERWYVAALAAFAAALLSKSAVLTLPLALLAIDRLVLRSTGRSCILRILPMLALGVLSALVTVSFEQKFISAMPSAGTRVLIAGAAPCFYAAKLVVPIYLLPIYPRWNVSAGAFWWTIPLGVWFIVAACLWRFRRRLDPLFVYGCVHFLVFLLPTLGLVGFGNLAVTYVSDHYLYLACIGFFLAVLTVVGDLRIDWPRWRPALAVAFATLVIGCIAVTENYIPVFKDAGAMWTRTLERNPDCFPAHAGLGRYYANRQEWVPALEHYRRAVALMPDQWQIALDLGKSEVLAGEYAAAEQTLTRVGETHPELPAPLVSLAFVAERTGRIERAQQLYERALALDPNDARVHVALAAIHLGYLRRDEAAVHFRRAIELRPHDGWAYVGLATCQRGQGQSQDAVQTLRRGLAAAPDDASALNLLARILATSPDDRIRDGREAVALAQRASTQTQQRKWDALDTLAAAYAETGQFERAVQTAQTAADLARAGGDSAAERRILASIEHYRRREPLRETSMQPKP